MLWETLKETGVWLTYIVGVVGVVLGGHPAEAEWKYDSSGPSIESHFEMTTGKDGAPMIKIPEGEFLMGANDGPRNERPEHTVYLDAYYIDQFEVTMERYQVFLDETYHDFPPLWDDGAAFEEAKDRPAVGMAWASAKVYCEWAGKRLPTEAEWEKAARGTDGRRYPWGHMQPFVDIARYNLGTTGWVSYDTTLASVTSGTSGMSIRHGLKQGTKSPFGLYHMAGNASEWVADWYDRSYYEESPVKNPTGPAEGERKIYRGGSWEDPPKRLRVTARAGAESDFPIEANDLTIGFRCVQDGKNESSTVTQVSPETDNGELKKD